MSEVTGQINIGIPNDFTVSVYDFKLFNISEPAFQRPAFQIQYMNGQIIEDIPNSFNCM
jgi:hypothetical protein